MFDLLIRSGTLVDGTGAPQRQADVAITGDRIVAVGSNLGEARREIDASGLLVTPGWVDVHTHYDGQATWDPYLTPSGWNGVTTVVMSNCGVGFAPVKPDQREFLIRLMEGVEDIPGSALSLGIEWDWETFPEYMDALDKRHYVADIAVQVPHGPVRVYVMGDRGARNEDATAADIEAMAAIVKEGLEAGALGFTTSRVLGHKSKNEDGSYGRNVPGTFAPEKELMGICRTLGEVGHGAFGVASSAFISGDIAVAHGVPTERDELAMLHKIAQQTGRPVTFACVQNAHDPDQWKRMLEACERAAAEGVQLVPQIESRPPGILQCFDGSVHPFIECASFKPLMGLSPAERRAELLKPDVRERLLKEEPDLTQVTPTVQFLLTAWEMMYPLGDSPDYEPPPEQSVAAIARREGKDPKAVAYDLLAAGDYLYLPMMNYEEGDFEVTRVMMEHPNALFGLADGGAHCGVISDASMPTFTLTHWVRDRTRGERLPLEWIIERQTSATARFCGLEDRGVIAPGMLADVNLIDFEGLHLHKPEMVYDLPGNERRLLQDVDGYRYTIKRGEVTYQDGEPTGTLPGVLVRGPHAPQAQ